MLIGAVYGRTSKETDDAYSVSTQVESGLTYAKQSNITIPREYVFREDFTGKALDRPEYGKIRKLIRERAIQVVIIYATDRLARKVSVGEILLDEMIDFGVELHIVAWNAKVRNTPEDKLRFNFESTFSSFERDKIVERTVRGKRKKASNGQIIGNARPHYGYKLNVYKTNFEPSPYAPIAREVLVSYGPQRMKTTHIAHAMQERGVKTPGAVKYQDVLALNKIKFEAGRLTEEQYQQKQQAAERFIGQDRWTEQTVYSIVENVDVYAGTYRFHVDGQEYTAAVPALITLDEAEEVKQALATGRRRSARKTETLYEHLMARRLTCGLCKHSYIGTHNQKGNTYYRCSGQRQRSPNCCANRPVRRADVDGLARTFVTDLLLHPQRLFAWWQKQAEVEQAANEETQRQLEELDGRMETTKAKLHRTLDRLTDHLDDDERAYYTQQKEYCRTLLLEYREDREKLATKLAVTTVDEAVVEAFAQLGEGYRETLELAEDFSFWRGLVDDLDLTAMIGVDEVGRRYVDFVLFKRVRRRDYLHEATESVADLAGS